MSAFLGPLEEDDDEVEAPSSGLDCAKPSAAAWRAIDRLLNTASFALDLTSAAPSFGAFARVASSPMTESRTETRTTSSRLASTASANTPFAAISSASVKFAAVTPFKSSVVSTALPSSTASNAAEISSIDSCTGYDSPVLTPFASDSRIRSMPFDALTSTSTTGSLRSTTLFVSRFFIVVTTALSSFAFVMASATAAGVPAGTSTSSSLPEKFKMLLESSSSLLLLLLLLLEVVEDEDDEDEVDVYLDEGEEV